MGQDRQEKGKRAIRQQGKGSHADHFQKQNPVHLPQGGSTPALCT